ncbi:MAG TPA: asparaginase domain-containing protein [Candidatus Saccharimonadales bacterium]
MKIKLLITGGTIDARYNYLKATVDYDKTHLKDMLDQGRSRVDIDIEQLTLVDSDKITDEQRQQILEKCNNAEADKIIITHGTDTMVETARFLGENIQDKTIVLVGSMIPYAFKGSDALFNLGAGVTAVQILDKGVFITMNGKVFNWDEVKKNFEIGEFQEKH